MTQPWPERSISRSIARATTSRGAQLRVTVVRGHEPDPRLGAQDSALATDRFRDQVPSYPVRQKTVGWNWMNSMSVRSAPARNAIPTPSPVATEGFELSR